MCTHIEYAELAFDILTLLTTICIVFFPDIFIWNYMVSFFNNRIFSLKLYTAVIVSP